METTQADIDPLTRAEPAKLDMTDTKPPETEWIIRRPKRAKLTAEESIRRTEAFIEKGKDRFIASIRKSKD